MRTDVKYCSAIFVWFNIIHCMVLTSICWSYDHCAPSENSNSLLCKLSQRAFLQIPGSTHHSLILYFVTKSLKKGSLLQRFADGDDDFRNSRLKLIPSVPKVLIFYAWSFECIDVSFAHSSILTSSGILDSATKRWKHPLLIGKGCWLQLHSWSGVHWSKALICWQKNYFHWRKYQSTFYVAQSKF